MRSASVAEPEAFAPDERGAAWPEMLICYSVCLWRDEKHSYQIHWRGGTSEGDWSRCRLAWQQSRARRLTDGTVLREAFLLSAFLWKERTKCSPFCVMDVLSINNLQGQTLWIFHIVSLCCAGSQSYLLGGVHKMPPEPFPRWLYVHFAMHASAFVNLGNRCSTWWFWTHGDV